MLNIAMCSPNLSLRSSFWGSTNESNSVTSLT